MLTMIEGAEGIAKRMSAKARTGKRERIKKSAKDRNRARPINKAFQSL